ncbi:MAG: class I SAM-dependent methyltransferase [Thermoplasmatales archaeon]|nr:MAG: class I SAM-dependent methyltransferase [Thermoplasmatales archaeon]
MVSNKIIAKEWDTNAIIRHNQIKSGMDISYHKILIPSIIKALGNIKNKKGLDVGCGTGKITRILAKKTKTMIGVDLSKEMIDIAEKESLNVPNISFIKTSIESFQKNHPHNTFDFCVSNMSFNTMPNLNKVIRSMSLLLKNNGILVFSIAHPCFWNFYKRLEPEDSFEYLKNHNMRVKFTISLDQKGLPEKTTYFHRPLEYYSKLLVKNGFIIENLYEPFPSEIIHNLYPQKWLFPHFLIFRCQLYRFCLF